MKVSIITVVYNGATSLSSCADSVLRQDYEAIEYIIIDGNSTDGTQEIVKQYGNKIAKFVSEPDKGIYDAMNKGINIATGDIIGILNADDFYAYDGVISDVVKAIKSEQTSAVYGDLEYVNKEGEIKRKWNSGTFETNSFVNGWMPPHPTFFLKRSEYEKNGVYRLDLGSAADYELMLRMIHKVGIAISYVPKVLVKMTVGGVSNSSVGNRLTANKNDRKAWKINSLTPRFYTLWLKPLRKIKQFL